MPVSVFSSSDNSEKVKLLERLEKIEAKEKQKRQDTEAVIGQVVADALESGSLTLEAFHDFIRPLVRKKGDAKKLGLVVADKSKKSSTVPEGNAMDTHASGASGVNSSESSGVSFGSD